MTLLPQERKINSKRKFSGRIPRTSGGHSRGYPGPKLQSGRSNSWKHKHLGADIHDLKVPTSTTLRDFQKLRSEKLRAKFSFPTSGPDGNQKSPRAHKNKIGTPPPKKPKIPPPLKRGILWTWFFLQKERIFPRVHKIDAPISGPRIADKNFTDTRIFFFSLSLSLYPLPLSLSPSLSLSLSISISLLPFSLLPLSLFSLSL